MSLRHILALLIALLLECKLLHAQEGMLITNDRPEKMSASIKSKLKEKGQASFEKLAADNDPIIQVHATWEMAKANKEKIKDFIVTLKNICEADPPEWWVKHINNIKYDKNEHSIFGIDIIKNKMGVTLKNNNTIYMNNNNFCGLSYTLVAIDIVDLKEKWRADVWSMNKKIHLGQDSQRIEMLSGKSQVVIYGCDVGGLYCESFKMSDGSPVVRFSTCYWLDYSEKWGIK